MDRLRIQELAQSLGTAALREYSRIIGDIGKCAEVFPDPVMLEPIPPEISVDDLLLQKPVQRKVRRVREEAAHQWQRLRLWCWRKNQAEWTREENLLKALLGLPQRKSFEIRGNKIQINISITVHADEVNAVKEIYRSFHERIELEPIPLMYPNIEDYGHVELAEFIPRAPLHMAVSGPEELKYSNLGQVFSWLSELDENQLGLYRVVFQKTQFDWHAISSILSDMEYTAGKEENEARGQYGNLPSINSTKLSEREEEAAHLHKPHLAVIMGGAVFSKTPINSSVLDGLRAFASLFRSGGRPLIELNSEVFKQQLSFGQRLRMLMGGFSNRTGMIMMSSNAVSWIHIPPGVLLQRKQWNIPSIEFDKPKNIDEGLVLGEAICHPNKPLLIIQNKLRFRGHVNFGITGIGKTVGMVNEISQDVAKGHSVVAFGNFGDAIPFILSSIDREPEEVIVLQFGRNDIYPVINPIRIKQGDDASRHADNLTSAVENVAGPENVGYRFLARLSTGIQILSKLSINYPELEPTLATSRVLFSRGVAGKRLHKSILPYLDNDEEIRLVTEDIYSLRPDAIEAIVNKLSMLLRNDSIGKTFSQWDNKVDFEQAMNDGKVILIDLVNLGKEDTRTVGTILQSLIAKSLLARHKISEADRHPTMIYVDEWHLYSPHPMESPFTLGRKFKVGISIFQQSFSQIQNVGTRQAIGNAATIKCFRLTPEDAKHFSDAYGNEVEPEEFMSLNVGEAIVKTENRIVKLKTLPPKTKLDQKKIEKYLQYSHEKYHIEAGKIKQKRREKERSFETF